MDRARKREDSDEPPVDKRACNSPSPAAPPALQPETAPAAVTRDCEMEESSSGRSDHVGESAYNSCDSDEESDHAEENYPSEDFPRNGFGKGRMQSVCAGLVDEKACVSSKVAALTELCEVLSFCMEDSIGYFPVDTIVTVLVRLAGDECSPEVMLLAIRAITYLCDAMPRMAGVVVRLEGLGVLCNKLLAISYLDVAEQSLQALEKISRRQPVPCLQAGIVNAVLCYIDFFSTSLQRVAVSTVSNMCKKVPLECASIVMESVPTLCNILQYDDKKLVETVVVCLTRIVDNFIRSTELLDEVCKYGIIEKSLELISNGNRISLSRTTFTGLLGLLTKLASSSLIAVKTLFEQNVSSTVRIILTSPDVSHGSTYASLEDVQSNQVHEALKLLNLLIPPMEKDSHDIQVAAAKEKILLDQPTFLYQLLLEIVPVSVQVVNSGANAYVSYCCVSVIKDLVYLSNSEMLIELIKSTNISSFLAGMLSRRDHHILIATLKTVEVLMQKLPDVCLNSFIKEGVVFAVGAFSSRGNCSDSAQPSNMPSDKSLQDRTRCLCYAFDSCHHPSPDMKACKLGKDNVYSLARHINTVYFTNETISSEMSLTESMKHLKTFCSKLNDNVDRCSTADDCVHYEEYLTHILGQVADELHGGESMSTFEFIESGVVRSLAQYFSNNSYLIGTSSARILSNHFVDILRRCQVFARLCFSRQGESWDNMLLTLLVRKLQKALSSLDTFPVIISPSYKPRNTYTDVPVRRATMNPCLKVRILRDKDEASLLEFDSILSIDITLSLATIEEYVWLKVQKKQCDSRKKSSQMIDGKECYSASASTSGNSSSDAEESSSAEVNRSRILQSLVEDSYNHISVATSSVSTAVCSQITEGEGQKLTLYLCGKPLDRSTTLYEAVLESQIAADSDVIVGPKLWSEVYQLTFRSTVELELTDCQNKQDDCGSSQFQNKVPFSWENLPSFSSMFSGELPSKLLKSNPSYDILYLLKCLDGLNHYSFHLISDKRSNEFAEGRIDNIDDLKVTVSSIPQSEFMSSKLTDKLEQQLRDPLVLSTGCMPSWCHHIIYSCPFLFSFETRWKYFQLVTFAPSAVLKYLAHHYIDSSANDLGERRMNSGLFSRKKFVVSRDSILKSAFEMMELHARSKGVLEVEYNEEVGTGLGPTMEFYTLVGLEFQKLGLGMWRQDKRADEAVDSGYVPSPLGLFPRPWPLLSTGVSAGVQFSEVEKKFRLLGKLVAKAIKDGRILDIPFSRAFYKLILEQELGIFDIQSFDPELGRTLLEFQALINRKKHLQSHSKENCKDESNIVYRNTSVEDLCLDFTLPGYSEYTLTENDSMTMVSSDNLEDYVALIVDATIKSGIAKQVEAFKSGFNEVFPLKSLQIFTEDELEKLLCGEQHTWNFTELVDHIKFDHGYTSNSPAVINLLEVIQEFGPDQRRAFLQFVTGAPRLPPGGLAALNPKLTVVRKLNGSDVDMDLPSVMTCANYLKLPPYSTKERMMEKLLYAITEGQGSFHLS